MKYFFTLIIITCSSVVFATPMNITISSGCKYTISGNVILSITGNLIVNGELSASATSTIKFCGTALQQIGGNTGISTFQNIEFDNSANFKLLGDVTVNGTIMLTNGIVSTGTKTLILPSTASFNPVTGSTSSFVDGNIKKTGNNTAFTFPVGDIQGGINYWAPLDMSAFDNTNSFTVNYTYKNPYDSLGINNWSPAYFAPTIHNVSGKEFWLIDRTGAGSQVPAVTLYWKDAVKSDIIGNAIPNSSSTDYDIGALADLTLVHWNSGTSKWDDMGGTATGIWPIGQITNSSAFTSYSPITFGSKTGKNPLPIELVLFNAVCNGKSVQLRWQTSSEINNNYFTIEKSTDAANWSTVATIDGMGNSNTSVNYQYTDINSHNDITYYHLKQTDFDGAFTYSGIIHTSCHENQIEIMNIFPNPAHDYFGFLVFSNENKDLYIKVKDVLGRTLICSTRIIVPGLNNMLVDVSMLAPAAYYFNIETADGKQNESKQILIK